MHIKTPPSLYTFLSLLMVVLVYLCNLLNRYLLKLPVPSIMLYIADQRWAILAAGNLQTIAMIMTNEANGIQVRKYFLFGLGLSGKAA